MRAGGLGAVGLLLLVVSMSAVSALYQPPVWSSREDLLVGSLTWNGSGGISWTPGASSADPGGPSPDASQGLRSYAGWNLRANTAGASGQDMLRTDVFTSEPIPSILYLNASRPIEVDLFLKSPDCEQRNTFANAVDIELWLGETFAGGALHGSEISPYYRGGQAWKAAHCVVMFNVHPEVDAFPAGSILKLKVIQFSQGAGYQYGLGEGHRSEVRIPFYPPNDVERRIPEIVAAAAEKPESSSQAFSGAALGGLALLVAPRRGLQGRGSVAALLMLALAVGGCIGGGPQGDAASKDHDADDGEVNVDVVPLENGTVRAGTGAIVGTVTDDYGYAIRGAHVTLLGTNNFTETDGEGTFQLLSIAASDYRLRIDKKEFVSIEVPIRVEEGKATRLDVIMVLLVDKAAGQRPHSHDYWEGLNERPLFSGDVKFVGTAGDSKACVPLYSAQGIVNNIVYSTALNANYNYASQGACYAAFYFQDRNIVAPGTYDIEAKVTWDQSVNKVERVGIMFGDNRPWMTTYNYTMMYPKKSGETTHIRTGWEMTDLGHQVFSMWRFMLYIPHYDGSGVTVPANAQGLGGPFHVEMKIKRGVLGREPAHPERYGANMTFNTMRDWTMYAGCYTGIGNVPACTQYSYSYYYANTYPYPAVLVPQETQWIQVWLNKTTVNTIPPQTNVEPASFVLRYKPANVAPGTAAKADYAWQKAKLVGKVGDSTKYIIPVKPEEADPFYAKNTMWTWQIVAPDGTAAYSGTAYFRFTMVSHRDAEPSSF